MGRSEPFRTFLTSAIFEEEKEMLYPRILTVQDISCVGQCSLTVALPILSACQSECCILPSAVLSTHTGGFSGFTFRDLTDDIPKIRSHWEKENISFHAIYTGYLGSEKQIGFVKDLFDSPIAKDAKIIVDPAMGDNGKLYTGFNTAYAKQMGTLCNEADVILPNITEACFMTGYPYAERYDMPYIHGLLDALFQLNPKQIILTGVSLEKDFTGVITADKKGTAYYQHKKIEKSFHGTGDIYASAFTGAWMHGLSLEKAAKIAADYTVSCIEKTLADATHWYGVKFELALPELIQMLQI